MDGHPLGRSRLGAASAARPREGGCSGGTRRGGRHRDPPTLKPSKRIVHVKSRIEQDAAVHGVHLRARTEPRQLPGLGVARPASRGRPGSQLRGHRLRPAELRRRQSCDHALIDAFHGFTTPDREEGSGHSSVQRRCWRAETGAAAAGTRYTPSLVPAFDGSRPTDTPRSAAQGRVPQVNTRLLALDPPSSVHPGRWASANRSRRSGPRVRRGA